MKNLILSGDGTPVETAARERSRSLSSDNRYYSLPGTDIGYDSSRDRYYCGYDLYLMTSADSDNDLPVFPLLNPSSMYDSFGLCHTYASMMAFLKECKVSEVLLDSAHDVMAIYQFCQENSISALIDLNERLGVSFKYKDNFTIGKDGIPVCEAGLKMIRDGTEKARKRIKYRCPEDFLLENGSHRSTKMWYCRLYCIMMCLHLDAWGSAPSTSLKDIFAQAA